MRIFDVEGNVVELVDSFALETDGGALDGVFHLAGKELVDFVFDFRAFVHFRFEGIEKDALELLNVVLHPSIAVIPPEGFLERRNCQN